MSASSPLSLDLHPPSEQLCYLHCNICDTVLAVSVPCTSLFKTITVRCGHCTNLLPVNMRGLLLPSAGHLHDLGHTFFSPSHNLLEQIPNPTPNFLINHTNPNELALPARGLDDLPRPPVLVNRQFQEKSQQNDFNVSVCPRPAPDQKRQRVPSAYNRFIKEEIQRIKAGNPDISHREAFSAAAKNWAHFPHIHFGLMPDQTGKKTNIHQQEEEDVLVRDGLFAKFASANDGVSPY
ncbi:hypothetical protein F0562_012938 [Nyssa sinensis]|uniref:Uncharacterized protein n=1 Tax=Nyssa sinensis TaxID=561372 RepID=A0A5J4ZU27_9ASTE|nr:hypothetical protein F0562_012938 [Nyssa sinensis]